MDDFDLGWFLEAARGLLAIPSTADRPVELHQALEYVLDFVGPGFTVQRFESGGKPSALVYAARSTARHGPAGTPQASAGQRWRSDQACWSTHRPISMIKPDCSASGINTVGRTDPRLGCFQRRRASTPVTRPSRVSTMGW